MSLTILFPLYCSRMILRRLTGASNGVALPMTTGSKSNSLNRTVVQKNQNIRTLNRREI